MKTPPYSRRVGAILQNPVTRKGAWGVSADGQNGTVAVITGSAAWAWAERHKHIVAVLDDPATDPESVDWGIVQGHPPILLIRAGDTDGLRTERLIRALLLAGAERVLDLWTGAIYIPKKVRHA